MSDLLGKNRRQFSKVIILKVWLYTIVVACTPLLPGGGFARSVKVSGYAKAGGIVTMPPAG
jgi:hypothetical protein